jgi:hypothetical protein
MIFAGLDCDLDALEAWNRWYDLEHVPPNVAMPGVMLGRRYVATPPLHEVRVADPDGGFANGRGSFLTLYTLCGEPAGAFHDMTVLRDQLYANDRMTFPADKKAVREGDVLAAAWSVGDPAITLPPEDVPFVGHTGVLVVQRRSEHHVREWYRHDRAPRLVRVEGVHGVLSLTSLNRPGLDVDIVYYEGDGATVTGRVRAACPHHAEATVTLDTPFDLIDPLRYGFIDELVASDLPRTVA